MVDSSKKKESHTRYTRAVHKLRALYRGKGSDKSKLFHTILYDDLGKWIGDSGPEIGKHILRSFLKFPEIP